MLKRYTAISRPERGAGPLWELLVINEDEKRVVFHQTGFADRPAAEAALEAFKQWRRQAFDATVLDEQGWQTGALD